MSDATALIYPILAQVSLTSVVLLSMGHARVHAVSAREVRMRDIALNSDGWPDKIRQIGNTYRNQFERPVLFHLLGVLAIVTQTSNTLRLGLAWAFVATRGIHTLIHITSNRVSLRFFAFLAGAAVLALMWGWFAVSAAGKGGGA